MTGYLLDTNVISELTKGTPDPEVIRFLSSTQDLWLPSILVYEVEYGLRSLPQGRRRSKLSAMHSGIISAYTHRILPLDETSAEWAAEFQVGAESTGRTIGNCDALIAGIARANELTVATRNVADFRCLGVRVVNPWMAGVA